MLDYRLKFSQYDPYNNMVAPTLYGVLNASYTKVLGGVGELQLVCNPSAFGGVDPIRLIDSKLVARLWVGVNGVQVSQGTDAEFVIKQAGVTQDGIGRRVYKIRAFDYNWKLARTVVAYRGETSQTSKVGNVDDLMKEFVSENLGADSTTDYDGGSVTTRQMSQLTVAGDVSQGDSTRIIGAEEQYLLDVLQDLQAESATADNEIFFSLTPYGGGLAPRFETRAGIWGVDKSGTAVFSSSRKNLLNPAIDYDFTEAATVAYASDVGEPADKEIVTREGAPVILGDFSRSEIWAHAGSSTVDGANVTDELNAVADATLAANRPKKRFEGRLVPSGSTPYGVNVKSGWNLGDRVTCYVGNVSISPIVRAVQVEMDEAGRVTIGARVETTELI